MTTQAQLYIQSEDLGCPTYVVINGVERPLRPEVALRGQSKFDIRRYTQDSANGEVELDDSRAITRTAYELRHARSDRYSSLAQSQPLVRAGKVPLDAMRKILGEFDDAIWRHYWILAELMDSQPRLRGLKLPKGKDAFLYRGQWTVEEDYDIDVSAMDPERDLVAVNLPKEYAAMNHEWKDETGITGTFGDASHYPADLDFAKKHLKGLNALDWGFRDRGGPDLDSDGRPGDWDSDWGALLGSRLSADEIVERFERTNTYELELSQLEVQLTNLEKYSSEAIEDMRQRISNLRNLHPQ